MRALITHDGQTDYNSYYEASRVASVDAPTVIRGWGDLDGPAHYVTDTSSTVSITVPDADLIDQGLLQEGD